MILEISRSDSLVMRSSTSTPIQKSSLIIDFSHILYKKILLNKKKLLKGFWRLRLKDLVRRFTIFIILKVINEGQIAIFFWDCLNL